MLIIDGSHGEGGGQLLRSALTLAALSGRAVRIDDIRAGRRKPGLAPQHLTAAAAAAAVCDGRLVGATLGSRTLTFEPQGRPRAGDYAFDVATAAPGGSAGAVTLVLQAVLLPLAFADGDSTVVVRGGTHVPWSPPFDYLCEVWLPTLAGMGLDLRLELVRSGWYPVGGGEVRARVHGLGAGARLTPLLLRERGDLCAVTGTAVGASLPAHVSQRMADRARALLRSLPVAVRIEPRRLRAACPGAGIFLTAAYANARAGFGALGTRGRPAEDVAAEAVEALLAYERGSAVLDRHLADQILLPCALAAGRSEYTVEQVTTHLTTNAWLVEQFGDAEVRIEGAPGAPGTVIVNG